MGASSSKDTELDEALSKFSEEERQKLDKLFDSLSSGTCLDKAAFKVGLNLIRENFMTLISCGRI